MPPNGLVDLAGPAAGSTVLGAGKTAMDTCTWLLDAGVEPDAICWIRSREPWTINRAFMQPLELLGSSFMQLQALLVHAAATATDAREFARRLEADGAFQRIDPDVEPEAFRGAIVSARELEGLRQIDNVVRLGRVLRIGTIGNLTWSAALLGAVEARRQDTVDQNRLCPPVQFTGNAQDLLQLCLSGLSGVLARSAEPDIAEWDEQARVNPGGGAAARMDDPQVAEAFVSTPPTSGQPCRTSNTGSRVAWRHDRPPAGSHLRDVSCVVPGEG
jgi:hypothetical protein